jgi:hypothetical protein
MVYEQRGLSMSSRNHFEEFWKRVKQTVQKIAHSQVIAARQPVLLELQNKIALEKAKLLEQKEFSKDLQELKKKRGVN